jgi:DNA polymerase-3 subunit delta
MAKLNPEQLAQALDKSLAPIYLVSGDEALLLQESTELIRKKARECAYEELQRYEVERGFDWQSLLASTQELSLFASKKIIELHIKSGKPGDDGGKALREFANTPPEDTLLIVVLPKLDKRSQGTQWFKSLEQAGVFISIWPVSAQQLPRWLGQRLRNAGINANHEAIDVLASKVEGNLLAAVQEIEKLKLLDKDREIDAEIMASAVMDSARFNVFQLVDLCLSGNASAASRCLSVLKAEDAAPLLLLTMLGRSVRSLCRIKESMAEGRNFDTAANNERVWSSKKAITRQAVDRLRLNQFYLLLRLLGQAEKAAKGLGQFNVWQELQKVVLLHCGVNIAVK